MKSEGQIKQKIKQRIYRHRKNYVEQGMAQKPANCQNNRVVRLPQHTGNRATIRVCAIKDKVCDSTMAGDPQAESCPDFEHCRTAEDLKNEFKERLGLDGGDVNLNVITRDYPDVALLMWVLDDNTQDNTDEP